jgi:D-amino peptidase
MSSSKLDKVLINEQAASEFFLHGHIASMYKIPLVFLSGDAGICEEVKKVSPNTKIHATMVGVGNSTISAHPQESRMAIKRKVRDALLDNLDKCIWKHPESFTLQVRYIKQQFAYKASHYPGVNMIDPKTVYLSTSNYDEVMRFFLFNV